MVQYILECIAFQLVFLIIYDLFLKRETFFQWNRLYLIGTYVLSLIIPWVKIEAMKTTVPEVFQGYPEYLWNLNNAAVVVTESNRSTFNVPWEYILLFGGMLLATLFFGYKCYQITKLKRSGKKQVFKDFTQYVIANSSAAFSFFKSIFLGDQVLAKEHQSIVQHELVHIRQNHSYDLLFFELMRIVGWFNPLVYVYQSRLSELHEFIADAQVAKTSKKQQYQMLLSEVFQTQNISFINQFFKSSLIKKRIVMLQKTKSKRIFQLKYLILFPIIATMLIYTSCEQDTGESTSLFESITVSDVENMTESEETKTLDRLVELSVQPKEWSLTINDKNSTIEFTKPESEDSFISGPGGIPIKAKMHIESGILAEDFDIFDYDSSKSFQIKINNGVPFGIVEEVPAFPGCENESDKRACFQKMMQKHISKNFRYPLEAQEKGIQGRVNVMFQIEKDGTIGNIRMRGPDKLLEDEVERIISRLPTMIPGKNKGKIVSVPFSIPVSFRLEQAGFGNFSNSTDKAGSEIDPLKTNYENTVPFAVVDEAPVFPGCEDEDDKRACFNRMIQKHISKNFRYPKEAQEKGIQGRVNVMFLIDTQGYIANIEKRGPDKLLEDEVVRIISRLPKFEPGSQQGKNVNVPFSIPITFRLEEQPDDFQFVNAEGAIFDEEQKMVAKKYNELLRERQRLLKNTSESDMVIKNLDEQLKAMKTAIYKNDN